MLVSKKMERLIVPASNKVGELIYVCRNISRRLIMGFICSIYMQSLFIS